MTQSERVLAWIAGVAAIPALAFGVDSYLAFRRASEVCAQFPVGTQVDSSTFDRSLAGRSGIVRVLGPGPGPGPIRIDDVPAKYQPRHDPESQGWGVTFSGVFARMRSCHVYFKKGRVYSAYVR